MDELIRKRLNWVRSYDKLGDFGLVCERFAISRLTLRKWYKRYSEFGLKCLEDLSRKPHVSPRIKRTVDVNKLILNLRLERNLGARRIQSELYRHHDIKLSTSTIHKALTKYKVKPVKKLPRKKKFKRYSKSILGERVQIDTCKIAPGIYQYTAIDDCSRWRVLDIYRRRTAGNTLDFLDKMIDQFSFSIQRIQSDRGLEFFAEKVQKRMMDYEIKFRPNKPSSPHLNGKVERSQKTDLEEFYAVENLSKKSKLEEWQFYYNWYRTHSSLEGKTPSDIVCKLSIKARLKEEISLKYAPEKEHIQNANYFIEMQTRKLKRSL